MSVELICVSPKLMGKICKLSAVNTYHGITPSEVLSELFLIACDGLVTIRAMTGQKYHYPWLLSLRIIHHRLFSSQHLSLPTLLFDAIYIAQVALGDAAIVAICL